MSLAKRWNYYRRIFGAYVLGGKSQLTFWHDLPQVNPNASPRDLGEYYMPFFEKADYTADLDAEGIPLLNYRGAIGLQYNPIAIAQWGLGNHALFRRSGDAQRRRKFLAASDWLCAHLQQNSHGVWVWNHHFDWEYRTRLIAPWYSGLAQGQGVSLLVRAHKETGKPAYLQCATKAFASFAQPLSEGGVAFRDQQGSLWFEEYIVFPPTHILNGFLWAIWGVYDYFLATGDPGAKALFEQAWRTAKENLQRYDRGFWSAYEQSGTRLPMIASPFYHQLHVVQLRVMHSLTGDTQFGDYADKWETYSRRSFNRVRALGYKSLFKLCYY